MKSKRHNGLILHADDLETGTVCTIHHWHDGRHFWCGDCLEITAINLPYIVAKFAAQPNEWPSITLDLRELDLMPVSREFLAAQVGGWSANLPDLPPKVHEDQGG